MFHTKTKKLAEIILWKNIEIQVAIQELIRIKSVKNHITVKFTNTSKTYSCSYVRAGESNVEEMKDLAINGSGLNTFINKYARNLFD